MKRGRSVPFVVLAVSALAVGCGGSGGGEGYVGLIRGLKSAARSGRPFDAVGRSAELSKAQRASLEAFCKVTRQMLTLGEAYKLSSPVYYLSRVKTDAEEHLPAGSTPGVKAAVGKMVSLYGLKSFDRKSARPYVNACYH